MSTDNRIPPPPPPPVRLRPDYLLGHPMPRGFWRYIWWLFTGRTT
ncbi:MAG: hypothetical protein Q8Q14_00750 [Gemmatimonadales bacterium]|nr:hypothetical protein [Gemmatimonadales bacterium]